MCKPGSGFRVLQGRILLDFGAVSLSKDLRQSVETENQSRMCVDG